MTRIEEGDSWGLPMRCGSVSRIIFHPSLLHKTLGGLVAVVFAMTAGISIAEGEGIPYDAVSPCLPAPDKTYCARRPSLCGYPDETNTGPVRGTVLNRVPQDVSSGAGWAWEPDRGRLRITGAGATVDSVEVHGQVTIDAPNVTLRNSKIIACNVNSIVAIRAGRPADGYNGDGARVENNLLGCDGPIEDRSDRGVSDVYGEARRLLIRRNNIWNVSNGVTVEREGLVQGNFVHDLGHRSGDHHSGLSNHGGAIAVVFDLNTVLLSQEGVSAPIVVYSDFAEAGNITVSRNLVSGGSYCFYGGESGEFAPAAGSILFVNNRLSTMYGQNGNCGIYGEIAAFAPSGRSKWSGNVRDEDLRPLGDEKLEVEPECHAPVDGAN